MFDYQKIYLFAHIISIYLSYFAFLVASFAAASYLVQDNFLKNKHTGMIFRKLPDLSSLDKLNYRSIGLGFPVLTLSIITGFIWLKGIHGSLWGANSLRQVYALVLWIIYAVILHMRLSEKLRGRKVAILSLIAFSVIILSLFAACH